MTRMFNFDSTLLLIFLMMRVCLSGIERKVLFCVFVNICTSTFAMHTLLYYAFKSVIISSILHQLMTCKQWS